VVVVGVERQLKQELLELQILVEEQVVKVEKRHQQAAAAAQGLL
jgi:hypothetical protein